MTHVVNASPIVPCFHRKRLRYRSIGVYDDEQDDIAQHFAATSAFIAKVLAGVAQRSAAGHGCTRTAACTRHLLLAVLGSETLVFAHSGSEARRCSGPLLCGSEPEQHADHGVPH